MHRVCHMSVTVLVGSVLPLEKGLASPTAHHMAFLAADCWDNLPYKRLDSIHGSTQMEIS